MAEDKGKSQEQSKVSDAETEEEGDQLTEEELASISGGASATADDGTPWAPQHMGHGGGYGE